jgi:hypothetical protein
MGKKKNEPITNPNTRSTSKAYWEKVLRSHNLGMSRGLTQEARKSIIYVGSSIVLENIQFANALVNGSATLNDESIQPHGRKKEKETNNS